MAINRPNLPYFGVSRQNDNYFKLLTSNSSGVPYESLDGYFNFFTDQVNDIYTAIAGINIGNLPGINEPANNNKLLTTNGQGTQNWVFVQASNILLNSITGDRLAPQTITTPQLGNACVTPNQLSSDAVTTIKILDENVTNEKLADDAVTTDKILDLNVTTQKLADGGVTTPKILDGNVTTPKLADLSVTAAKVNSGAAVTRTVLMADGAGNASYQFQNVLQVVTASTNQVITSIVAIPRDDTVPQITEGVQMLTATITPKSATSILYFKWLGSLGGNYATFEQICTALFQNGTNNALCAQWISSPSVSTASGAIFPTVLNYNRVSGSTAIQTFQIRIGENSGNRIALNTYDGTNRVGGGSSIATFEIWEVAA